VVRCDGETVCEDCGVIFDDATTIDHGPEWRTFTPAEHQTRCRTGPVRDPSEPDYGHGTSIGAPGCVDRAAVSPRRRRLLSRMRTLARNDSTRYDGGDGTTTAYGLAEVRRMMTSLGYHDSQAQRAAMLFRRGQAKELAMGRSLEAHAAAAVYASLRIDRAPVTLTDVAHVARIELAAIRMMYDVVTRDLELPVPPQRPVDYVPRVASAVSAPPALEQAARDLLEVVADTDVVQGKHPAGLAAAAINAIVELSPPAQYYEDADAKPFTQAALADEAGVTARTVRSGTDLFDHLLCGDGSPGKAAGEAVAAPIVCHPPSA
jgi:transcription initiation factor TFIIB